MPSRSFALIGAAAFILTACEGRETATYISSSAALPQISVSATGASQVAPDIASVSAGVVTQGKIAAEAMAANSELMNAVFAELSEAKIERKNIATSQLSLQPRYDYSNRQAPRITAYEARNTVTVKTENLEQVGPMIDALIAAGLNNINQVQFSVKDPKSAQESARSEAIKDARKKAQNMAKAAGVELGDLQSLSESGGYSPQPQYRLEMSMAADAAPTPVAPGEQNISVTVNMVYAIKN